MFLQIIFNHWTSCEYIAYIHHTNGIYLSIMITHEAKSENKFIRTFEGRFGIMVNMDFLLIPWHPPCTTLSVMQGRRVGMNRERKQTEIPKAYVLGNNCKQQKPYVHEISFFGVEGKARTKKNSSWWKDIHSALTKKALGTIGFPSRLAHTFVYVREAFYECHILRN